MNPDLEAIIDSIVKEIERRIMNAEDLTNDKKIQRELAAIYQILNDLNISVEEYFPGEIVQNYAEGYTEGADQLKEIGFADIAGNLQDLVHSRAVQELAIKGMSDLQAAIRTAGETIGVDIDQTLNDVRDALGGSIVSGQARKVATAEVKKAFAKNGLRSFKTIDGRWLPLDFYAKTVVRTKRKDAHTNGAANRYRDNDVDLVQISERHPTCSDCAARQGLIVSLSGNDSRVPSAEEVGLPPFHPNCRHSIRPITSLEGHRVRSFTDTDRRTKSERDLYKHEQDIRRKANQEKKQYMKMKAEAQAAGQDFPNIGVWRRMKRRDDKAWQKIQDDYRTAIKRVRANAKAN